MQHHLAMKSIRRDLSVEMSLSDETFARVAFYTPVVVWVNPNRSIQRLAPQRLVFQQRTSERRGRVNFCHMSVALSCSHLTREKLETALPHKLSWAVLCASNEGWRR